MVILLAIAVGLFRLMLPRLPEYQEQIKGWASAAIGMRVEFSDMDARWRLSGPELSFSNARLSRAVEDSPLLSVEEVSVGVSLMRLLSDRELVADRMVAMRQPFACGPPHRTAIAFDEFQYAAYMVAVMVGE